MASPCLLVLISVTMFCPVLFYNYISNLSIHITYMYPFLIYIQVKYMYFTNCTNQTILSALRRFHRLSIPHFSRFFWLLPFKSCTAQTTFASSLMVVFPSLFNCIFYSAILFVMPQHSASAAHYVLTGGFFFFFFFYFTLPPQHL